MQENILKLLSNRITNGEISVKFACATIHQNFAVTLMENLGSLMDNPGYFCAVLILYILVIIPSVNYIHIGP